MRLNYIYILSASNAERIFYYYGLPQCHFACITQFNGCGHDSKSLDVVVYRSIQGD